LAAVLVACFSSGSRADGVQGDNFEQGNGLGWLPADIWFPGDYTFAVGDYVFQPFEAGENRTLVSTVPIPFERWDQISTRSLARSAGPGKVGVAARFSAAAGSGYAGVLDTTGRLELWRLDAGVPILLAESASDSPLSSSGEVFLSLTSWDDQFELAARATDSNEDLLTLSAVDATYAAGQAGLVFAAEAPGSSGVFHDFTFVGGYYFPGDIDQNRIVDLTDFGWLKRSFGQSDVFGPGINGDNKVDLTDCGLLKGNFGRSAGPSPSPVPEPAAGWLGLLALLGWRFLSSWPQRRRG
jgi:hypothetical protein